MRVKTTAQVSSDLTQREFVLTVNTRSAAPTQGEAVAIFGLGYVGLTLAVAAADAGYRVVGLEIQNDVLETIKHGKAHFFEVGINERLSRHVASGKITVRRKLLPQDRCSTYIITVGTPIGPDKRTQTESIISVMQDIRDLLQPKDLVILRSTVRVGVTRDIAKVILDQSGLPYHLAFCPERTIEGQALLELRELPQIVGGLNVESRDLAFAFFSRIASEVITVESVEAAELVKLINNTERDLRFAFANEVAAICDVFGLKAHDVIAACNYRYPRSNLALPGPVGGPCLTKDPYILAEGLETHGLKPQLALVGRETNEALIGSAVSAVRNALAMLGSTERFVRIGILGLAFKGRPATDDLRGSTVFDLLQAIHRNFPGASIVGYDPVAEASAIALTGMQPVESIEQAFAGASAVFLHNNHPDLANLPLQGLGTVMARPAIVYDFWAQNRNSAGLPENVWLTGLGYWPTALSATKGGIGDRSEAKAIKSALG